MASPNWSSWAGEPPDDFNRALESQVLPALTVYSENPDLLEKRREERDLSASTESLGHQYTAEVLEVIPKGALEDILAKEEKMYLEHEAILRREVTIEDVMEHELKTKSGVDPYRECATVGRPIARLGAEAKIESIRISSFRATDDRCDARTDMELNDIRYIPLDQHAMERHFVRQRWEMMRIWNDKWRRTTSPKKNWTWPWQKKRPEEDGAGNLTLLRNAIDKCGSLQPGEFGALVAHRARNQKPRGDWTAAEGNRFLDSRPWFAFDVECMVERTRRSGVRIVDNKECHDKKCWQTTPADFIRRQWEKLGLWRKRWDYVEAIRIEPNPGWRWKCEGCQDKKRERADGDGDGDDDDDDDDDEPRLADLEELRWIKDTLETLKKADQAADEMVKREAEKKAKKKAKKKANEEADEEADEKAKEIPVPKRSRRIVERQARKRRAAEEEEEEQKKAAEAAAEVQGSAAVVAPPRRGRGRGASQQPVTQPPPPPPPAGGRRRGRGASQQPVTQPPPPPPAVGRRQGRGASQQPVTQPPPPPPPAAGRGRGRREASQQPAPPPPPARAGRGKRRAAIKEEEDEVVDAAPEPAKKRRRRG